ncbi:MAG: recombination protein RecR [Xanthomonadales bacterium]|nr:recombination protein RecR [Xanthomonadales bacterium]
MSSSPKLDELIDALRCLPGVGARTAQRMAHQLLERNREGGRRLAQRLSEAMDGIGNCRRCRNYSDTELCTVCANASRDESLLCVIEMPADQLAIEQATHYRGLYYVLLGRLSPLDGMGPRELGLDRLATRLAEGQVCELIIATNPTVEGEATAHYLAQLARQNGVRPSRLAHGVPLGGELEYIDRGTLAHAFSARQNVE